MIQKNFLIIDIFKKGILILNNEEKKKIIIISFLLFVVFFFEALSFGSLIPFIKTITNSNNTLFLSNFITYSLDYKLFLILIVIILFLIKNIFIFISTRFNYSFSFNLKKRIINKFYSNFLNLDYEDQINESIPVKINKITTEVNYFTNFINSLLIIFSEVMIVVIITIILMYYNLINSIFFIFLILISYFLLNFLKKKTSNYSAERVKNSENFTKHLFESLHLIREIKIFSAFTWFKLKLDNSLAKYLFYERKQAIYQSLPKIYFEILSILFLTIFFYFLSFKNEKFEDSLVFFSILVLSIIKLMPSFQKIIFHLQNINFSFGSVSRIYNEIKAIDKKKDLLKPVKINKQFKLESIKFNKIFFKYKKFNNYIIKNLNFDINRNDKILIFGKSGRGKTTLLNIIIGLLKPTKGSILVNKSIKINDMSSYTSSGIFSLVPQKNYLLDDTLETNLLFGRKKIKSKLKRAIKTSFIRELNNNNFLGDGGLKLSGGQAQRVSIARAIYGDSQLIIFDEPTTYLDNNLKYKFIKFLKSLNKTIILVSHDKSLFSVANKIVYLK